MDATPSTSGISNPLVIGREVVVTPQGSLRVAGSVLLERSTSGRLRSLRPENLSVGEGISFLHHEEQRERHLSPRNLFPEDQDNNDVDNIFGPRLAEELALDSGSDKEDEELTMQELQEVLQSEDDEIIDDGAINTDFDWSNDFTDFQGSQEEFHENARPKIGGTRPLELFTQIWDQTLMESIVTETNRYAWEQIAPRFETEDGLPKHSRLHDWIDTSCAELYRLFAIIMLMGICIRGHIDMYWSNSKILGMPGFREVIQKDRFLLLMRFLHFANNNEINCHGPERKLAKIKPLLDYLNLNKYFKPFIRLTEK
ncbi:hypothetical protein O0L34_g10075 [Tuta absoluta]|nr:hypothetical protein O0L34_g10075 [Tuta absoluta]